MNRALTIALLAFLSLAAAQQVIPNSLFPIGTSTVQCSSTDTYGNRASTSFNVIVRDTTAPKITVPTDVIIEATGPQGAIFNFTSTASDIVDTTDVSVCTPASGSTFPIGVTKVTCIAKDTRGNRDEQSFTVTVRDTTTPNVQVPASPVVAEATGPSGAIVTFAASADDAVDGTSDAVVCYPRSASTFTIGTTIVNCTAVDATGNVGSSSFSVVVKDTTAPSITVPPTIIQEATGNNGAIIHYQGSAIDIVDGETALCCLPATGSVFPIGNTTVTCSSFDKTGNARSKLFQVTVCDTTAPAINYPAAGLIFQAASPSKTVITFITSANDLVDGPEPVLCEPPSGTAMAIGSSIVICTAHDSNNNINTVTFPVTVVDTAAPLISVPSVVGAEATSPQGARVPFSVTANDVVDGSTTVTCSPASMSIFGVGATNVTCTSTDSYSNSAFSVFTVQVVDTTRPVLSLPQNMVLEATKFTGAVATFTVSASDIVDTNDVVTCTPASGSQFKVGTTTVRCESIDQHGNVGTGSFDVTVVDTTAPVLYLPVQVTAAATSPKGAVVYFVTNATDIVDITDDVTCNPASGKNFVVGETIVNCQSTDAHGNIVKGSFVVEVYNPFAPVVIVPGTQYVEATSANGAVLNFTASDTDVVDVSAPLTCSPASGSTFAIGTTTVICTSTNAAGLTGSESFQVIVRDSAAPKIGQQPAVIVEATSPGGAVASYNPTAFDVVDGVVPVSCDIASGSTFKLGTSTVTCKSTDTHNNNATMSFTVTVMDTTAPVVVVPADMIIEATNSAGAKAYFGVSASDIYDVTTPVICNYISGDTFQIDRTTTVVCRSSDAAGNIGTASFTVTVRDTTAPSVVTSGDQTIEATSTTGAVVVFSAVAHDVVDSSDTVTCIPASGSTFALGTTAVVCSATDKHGNVASSSFKVLVQDTTAPRVLTPFNNTYEATSANGAVANYNYDRFAFDAADGTDEVTCTPASGSLIPIGTTQAFCSAKDKAGNSARVEFTLTVVDSTAPTVIVPANQVVEAVSGAGAIATWTVNSVDVVDGSDSVDCVPPSGSLFPLGISSVTCIAVDSYGNKGTNSFSVTVRDTTAPVISVPADITKESTSSSGATIAFETSASDVVDVSDPVVCQPPSGATFTLGDTTVTCSSVDRHGNGAVSAFKVTVRDTTAPVIYLPQVPDVEATFSQGAVVTFIATASDITDRTLPVSCEPQSGSIFALGQTAVRCSATDSSYNVGSGNFTVNVKDTTAPMISLPADIVAEATGAVGSIITYTSSATDLYDVSDPVVCIPASGSIFNIGLTTVVCTSTDKNNNQASKSFTVRIVDTTAPVIALPASQIIEAQSPKGSVATFTTSSSDIVDGTDNVYCTPTSGSTFAVGVNTVSCISTDAAGNTATGSFTVTVTDTTAPVLSLPTKISYEATSSSGAIASWTASATDIVEVSTAVTCSPPSGSQFQVGTTTITCLSIDSHGNSKSGTFDVEVKDTTTPVLVLPVVKPLEATSPAGATGNYVVYSTDIVDGVDDVTCVPPSGSVFAMGNTTVQCTSTDKHGNTGTGSFVVTVLETSAPVIIVPKDQTVEATSSHGAVLTFQSSASDVVDVTTPLTCAPPSGSVFPIGATTVTCASTNSQGNTDSKSFVVTVVDTTAPQLYMPEDQVIEAVSPSGSVASFLPTSYDIVDGSSPVTCVPPTGSIFAVGTTTVTCSSTDIHGNVGTGLLRITVKDTTKPVIQEPANIVTEAVSGSGAAATWSISAFDTVDSVTNVVCSPASGSTFAIGVTTVSCITTDKHQNTQSASFTVTVQDTTAPILSLPVITPVEATSKDGAAVTFVATSSDIVDGKSDVVICYPSSGYTFKVGVSTIQCSSTDVHNNAAYGTFQVTVTDYTAPIVTVPQNQVLEATSPNGAILMYNVSASDVVDVATSVVCDHPSGSVFPVDAATPGVTTVVCTSTDANGNIGTNSFTVTVKDTTVPVLHISDNKVLESTSPSGTVVSFSASSYDIVDGSNVIAVCNPPSDSVFAIGTTAVK
jgi:hypothetical protein